MSDRDDSLPAVADYSVLLRLDWRNHWLSTAEYARHISRPQQTVRNWIVNGTLDAFNIPHLRDRRGRHWIKHIR